MTLKVEKSDMASPVLSIVHVTKRFGGLVAVDDISFDMNPTDRRPDGS